MSLRGPLGPGLWLGLLVAGCTRSAPLTPEAPAVVTPAAEPSACEDALAWTCARSDRLPTVASRAQAWRQPPADGPALQASPMLAEHLSQCKQGPVGPLDAELARWTLPLTGDVTPRSLWTHSGALEAAGLPGLLEVRRTPLGGRRVAVARHARFRGLDPVGNPLPAGGWKGIDLHVQLANSRLEPEVSPDAIRDRLVAEEGLQRVGDGALPLAEVQAQFPELVDWARARGLEDVEGIEADVSVLALAASVTEHSSSLADHLRFLTWAALSPLGDDTLALQSSTLGTIWQRGVLLDDVLTADQRCHALVADRLDVARAQFALGASGLDLPAVTAAVREAWRARVSDREDALELQRWIDATRVFVGSPEGQQALPPIGASRVDSALARRAARAEHHLADGFLTGPEAGVPTCMANPLANTIHCGLPALLPYGAETDGADPAVVASVAEALAHEWTHVLEGLLNDGVPPEVGPQTPRMASLMSGSACLFPDRRVVDDAGALVSDALRVWSEAHADHMGAKIGLTAWQALGHTEPREFFAAVASSSCEAEHRPGGPYLPPRERVNGNLAGQASYRAAFECSEGDPMVAPVCEVW